MEHVFTEKSEIGLQKELKNFTPSFLRSFRIFIQGLQQKKFQFSFPQQRALNFFSDFHGRNVDGGDEENASKQILLAVLNPLDDERFVQGQKNDF